MSIPALPSQGSNDWYSWAQAVHDAATDVKDGRLKGTYVPKWQPSTAYTAGDPVLNPFGQIVTANSTFTSGATYSAANWTVVVSGGGAVSSVAGRTGAVVLSTADVTGLATIATSGAYADLSGKPTIPAAYTDAQAVAANASVLASKAPQLVPTATKTAAYTAAVNDLAVMNVAGGATTLTLPTTPADRAQVGFLAVGATTAAPLTVTRGGTDTLGPSGATSVTAVLANEVTVLQYDAANTRWLAVSNVKPQTALDARYTPTAPAARLSQFDATKPTWTAHRGGGGYTSYSLGPVPENTLEGMRATVQAARARGITNFMLNVDVREMADGGLAVIHDATVDRTTTGTGNVADYNSQAWANLVVDAGAWQGGAWGNVKAPFLSDVLDEFGGKVVLSIGAYTPGGSTVGQKIVNEVVARGLQDSVMIGAFSTAQLTPAVAAGIATCYNPPDPPTAGSDAASISALAGIWTPGKPKTVAINGAASTVDAAYVASLVAAGFSVNVYGILRRYDRDRFLAMPGVSGITSDELIYVQSNTAVWNQSISPTADPLVYGFWPHGVLEADQSRGRGSLVNGGMKLDYTAASGAQAVVYGTKSPPANLTAYTLTADFVWDQLDGTTDRYPYIVLCCPDDRPTSFIAGTGSGYVDGYQVLFRQNAANMSVARASQTSQSQAGVLTQSTGLPPAPTAGTVTTFQIQVTATTLVVSLIQGGTTYGPFTATDSTYRGGYFHLGKNQSSNATKLVGTWKNVKIT